MTLTLEQVKACKEVVLISEKCVRALSKRDPYDNIYQRSFKQCQDICVTFLHAASTDSIYIEKLGLLCIGICEECAEICDDYSDSMFFREAAKICRYCSGQLSELFQYYQTKEKVLEHRK